MAATDTATQALEKEVSELQLRVKELEEETTEPLASS